MVAAVEIPMTPMEMGAATVTATKGVTLVATLEDVVVATVAAIQVAILEVVLVVLLVVSVLPVVVVPLVAVVLQEAVAHLVAYLLRYLELQVDMFSYKRQRLIQELRNLTRLENVLQVTILHLTTASNGRSGNVN